MNTAEIIESRNKQFKEASREDRRRLLAQETINLIQQGLFQPESGFFVILPHVFEETYSNYLDRNCQVAVLEGSFKKCKCCALGGLLLSGIAFNNKSTIREFNYSNLGGTIKEKRESLKGDLHEAFSHEELELIEIAFEQGEGYFDITMHYESGEYLREDRPVTPLELAAREFGLKYEEPTERLIAIMNNIIEHGTFTP